ncbi:phage GP46 family protein, partial [Candidatus Erwinia dacicola]
RTFLPYSPCGILPAMDAYIDHTTGDYTGQRCTDLHNAVWLRLRIRKGTYWADPQMGSRLHELARAKDMPQTHTLARQYAEQALQPLIDDKRATAVDVVVTSPETGWLQLSIMVTQAGGNVLTFTH